MSFLHTKFLLMNALLGLGVALLKPPQLGKEIPYLPQTTLVKRIDNTQASFYACDDANWGGRCQWFQAPVGECLNMPILLQDQISSFGPDLGYICSAYIDTNCQPDGDSVKIYQYPGVADLNKEALQWNDRISSVKCVLTNPQDSSVPEAAPPDVVTSTTLSTFLYTCSTVTVDPRVTYALGKRWGENDDGTDLCQ